ncbi:hypothetical protein TVAG_251220 [Trichomonas vaginalis G3]|uniref:Uncharacterized protein n=1 Tax=Trichomonas vaginalis (strain ATCC PRA-98 / G3) TaxID=412133 RepID=A2FUY7_TRIV3|nr:hypothetical protein TVAGG3_0455690 [Trichomonas vaginalis G3]EAX91278.1 hypothetical protein TVAG_251220 [Trichomonas vaginalis G3]KAI5538446.1 hypothetical protein TVAGG3_0455690 [Trichomonas vaginalis G3]|eukprot:XP_001304208.1 hypothetical protein [Trichomonas vaginalis G3]
MDALSDNVRLNTVREMKRNLNSNIIKAMIKVFPDAQSMIDDFLEAVQIIEYNNDLAYLRNFALIHDTSFLNYEKPATDFKQCVSICCSSVSLYGHNDENFKHESDSEDEDEIIDEPLNLEYERSLNSSPLVNIFYDIVF